MEIFKGITMGSVLNKKWKRNGTVLLFALREKEWDSSVFIFEKLTELSHEFSRQIFLVNS